MAGSATAVEASTNQVDYAKLLQQLQARGGFNAAQAAMIEAGAFFALPQALAGSEDSLSTLDPSQLQALLSGGLQTSQVPGNYNPDGTPAIGDYVDDGKNYIPWGGGYYPGLFPQIPQKQDDNKTVADIIKDALVAIFDGLLGDHNGKIDTPAEKKMRDAFLESLKEDGKTGKAKPKKTDETKPDATKPDETAGSDSSKPTGGSGGISVDVTVIVNGKEQKPNETAVQEDAEPVSDDDKKVYETVA